MERLTRRSANGTGVYATPSGETLYMNCRALGIVDRKLNSTSVMSAISEAQSLTKQELDLLSKELNTILNSEIEISRH